MTFVVVAAHPDDETISAGGRLLCLENPTIIHVTDGAPRNMLDAAEHGLATRDDYARARRAELTAALAIAGIGMERRRAIELVDQEASFHLAELAITLAEILREIRPDVVLTHPYEGGHPDHDATAFAVHAARGLLARAGDPVPALLEFASYHDKDGTMSVFDFLPCDDCEVQTIVLSGKERELKRRMIACFVTQQKTLAQFPIELERFRPAPPYDFTQPPHAGALFYERHDFGMPSAHWRALAREALETLGLSANNNRRFV
ncbi:MAG: PIG-L family deacetylase [Chloroflexi bacterium]|nr:PIG-L family deacetylase [Chloroflexota bacterium]